MGTVPEAARCPHGRLQQPLQRSIVRSWIPSPESYRLCTATLMLWSRQWWWRRGISERVHLDVMATRAFTAVEGDGRDDIAFACAAHCDVSDPRYVVRVHNTEYSLEANLVPVPDGSASIGVYMYPTQHHVPAERCVR